MVCLTHRSSDPWGRCNIRHPPKNLFKPKSREISFAHNLLLSYLIVLEFCTEHDSDTVVLYAKFQNDWTSETNVLDERDFARFEFKTYFGPISYRIYRTGMAWCSCCTSHEIFTRFKFCYDCATSDYTHIFQDYSTGTGASHSIISIYLK